jgi:two-component sensor histidine kinase
MMERWMIRTWNRFLDIFCRKYASKSTSLLVNARSLATFSFSLILICLLAMPFLFVPLSSVLIVLVIVTSIVTLVILMTGHFLPAFYLFHSMLSVSAFAMVFLLKESWPYEIYLSGMVFFLIMILSRVTATRPRHIIPVVFEAFVFQSIIYFLKIVPANMYKATSRSLDDYVITMLILALASVSLILELRQNRERIGEKEVLLMELYHRTKNNMQVIISMLEMEAARMDNDRGRAVFQEMENRIQAMALVHQKLYLSQNLSTIDIKEYLEDLTGILVNSYNTSREPVTVRTDIENMTTLIDIAIPCGLILNEMISNSLKHAFSNDRKDKVISVRLRKTPDGSIEYGISDNGQGAPKGFDPRSDGKMGLKSVIAIAENQLLGKTEFRGDTGFSCMIRFNENIYAERI